MQSIPQAPCKGSMTYAQSGVYDSSRMQVTDVAQALQQKLCEQHNTLNYLTSITENLYQVLESTREDYNNALMERDSCYRKLQYNNEKLQQVAHVIRRYAQVKDPVTASDGFTYEREQIEVYLQDCKEKNSKAYSMQTKEELTDTIIPNLSLINLLKSFSDVHEMQLPSLSARRPIMAHAGSTNRPIGASSPSMIAVGSSNVRMETNSHESSWSKMVNTGADGMPNVMRGVDVGTLSCEVDRVSATIPSTSMVVQKPRSNNNNTTGDHVVVNNNNNNHNHNNNNSGNMHRHQNKYNNINHNHSNTAPTSAYAVPRPASVAKQQSLEQLNPTPLANGEGVSHVSNDAPAGVASETNMDNTNHEDTPSTQLVTQIKQQNANQSSANRRSGDGGSYKHDSKSSSHISGRGGETPAQHPCLRVYGHCNFMNDCTFTKYPYEACLNNIKGKCRFGAKCKELHVDPRKPEYQNPRKWSSGTQKAGNNSNSGNANTNGDNGDGCESTANTGNDKNNNQTNEETHKTQAKPMGRAKHVQAVSANGDAGPLANEVATDGEAMNSTVEGNTATGEPRESRSSDTPGIASEANARFSDNNTSARVTALTEDHPVAAGTQSLPDEKCETSFKSGVESINSHENDRPLDMEDVSRAEMTPEEVTPHSHTDDLDSAKKETKSLAGEASNETELVLQKVL